MIKLSIVIPCYNESGNLENLYTRVTKVAQEMAELSYEIILIDDGSADDTWHQIVALAKKDENVKGILLSRNYGHQLALTAGLHACKGSLIAVLDADLQDPPELLPEMVALLEKERADVVYGTRDSREGESAFKLCTASLFYRILNWLSDIAIPQNTGDFRVMRKNVVDALNAMPETFRFIRGMISWLGFKQIAYHYHRKERQTGVTGYSLVKMIRLALDGVTGFSVRPLRLASYLGLMLAIGSMLLLLYTFYSWAVNDIVRGWTSLMGVMLLLFSVQFILLGIIGEYIGRIFIQSKQRLLYVIKETTGYNSTQ